MGQAIRKGILIGFLGIQTLLGGKVILHNVSMLNSEYIPDQAHLEVMLQEEEQKLGIQDKVIHARFGSPPGGLGACRKIGENSYEIVLDPSNGRKVANLRHELYHIADGHLEGLEECSNGIEALLNALFVYEPQADLYEFFGVIL